MSNISRFIGNERGDKICHEDDGCPTELAVLKRFWREQQASTLPEEVDNLVELLDEEEVPYEDSLGVALSLTGRTKQYANGKTATLREQVEKLTKELDNVKQVEFPRRVQKVTDALKRKHEKELAALAEQNAKMRKALTEWRYLDSSYNWRCGHCGNEVEDGHKEGCALSLPNLSTPVLNKYRAEGMRMAAEICEHISDEYREREGRRYPELKTDAESGASDCESSIRAQAHELENSNG